MEWVSNASGMMDGTSEKAALADLRTTSDYHPEFDLVAWDNHEIVGQIALQDITLPAYPATKLALLTTLCVIPSHRHNGIGTQLLLQAISNARHLHYAGIVAEGDPAFFERLGFKVSSAFDLVAADSLPLINEDDLLVLELTPNALAAVAGEINY